MIPLFDYILFILLAVMTYHDLKKQSIPNYLIAILWILMAGLHPEFTSIAVFIVGFIMLLNYMSVRMAKNEFLGWGDVLILPIVFAWGFALFGYMGSFTALALAFSTGTAVALASKKTIPLVAFIGIYYIILGLVMG